MPDDEVPEDNTTWSAADALNAHRGGLPADLTEARKDALIADVEALPLERGPLNLQAFDQANVWDDYSVLLARDECFGRAG